LSRFPRNDGNKAKLKLASTISFKVTWCFPW